MANSIPNRLPDYILIDLSSGQNLFCCMKRSRLEAYATLRRREAAVGGESAGTTLADRSTVQSAM
jgi:hypothetical protein